MYSKWRVALLCATTSAGFMVQESYGGGLNLPGLKVDTHSGGGGGGGSHCAESTKSPPPPLFITASQAVSSRHPPEPQSAVTSARTLPPATWPGAKRTRSSARGGRDVTARRPASRAPGSPQPIQRRGLPSFHNKCTNYLTCSFYCYYYYYYYSYDKATEMRTTLRFESRQGSRRRVFPSDRSHSGLPLSLTLSPSVCLHPSLVIPLPSGLISPGPSSSPP